jgi:hypothetical protein
MNSGYTNPKMAGVRSTRPATEGGAPRTVQIVTPAEFFAVSFTDEQGRTQNMVVLRVGDFVYVPPGSIEWAGGLKQAAPWLAAEVQRQAGRTQPKETSTEFATSDGVDVLDQEKAEKDTAKKDGDASQASP